MRSHIDRERDDELVLAVRNPARLIVHRLARSQESRVRRRRSAHLDWTHDVRHRLQREEKAIHMETQLRRQIYESEPPVRVGLLERADSSLTGGEWPVEFALLQELEKLLGGATAIVEDKFRRRGGTELGQSRNHVGDATWLQRHVEDGHGDASVSC